MLVPLVTVAVCLPGIPLMDVTAAVHGRDWSGLGPDPDPVLAGSVAPPRATGYPRSGTAEGAYSS